MSDNFDDSIFDAELAAADQAAAPTAPQPTREPAAAPPTATLNAVPPKQEAFDDSVFDSEIQDELKEAEYGTAGQMALTGIEGAAKGLLGPAATLLETRALGIPERKILARQQTNPITHGIGEIGTLVGGAIAGTGLGGALGKAGEAVAGGAELAGLGKVGSSVARLAAENAAYQVGDEASKLILKDPSQSADTAAIDIGLAGLIGGGFGLAGPLWNATLGKKMGGMLGAVADKMGGIEGVASKDIENVISKAGVDMAPELKALLAKDPQIQQSARTLLQTDANVSGLEYQKKFNEFRKQLGDNVATSFGRDAEALATGESLNKYDIGKKIGDTLASEYDGQLQPFSEGFNEIKAKFKGIDLPGEIINPETGDKIPSMVDDIGSKIQQLAIDEGWVASPSSDKMKLVNKVMKELPLQKNLKSLSSFITEVGDAAQSKVTPLDNSMSRVGQQLKSILKDAESNLMEKALGAEAGPAAVEHFKALREGYAVQGALRDALADRVGNVGGVSSFSKGLKEMARTDAEGLLRRLAGKGDADLLSVLQKHFPETASLVRDYHIDELLHNGVKKAGKDMNINAKAVLKNLEGMSPQLKAMIVPPEMEAKLTATSQLLEALENPKHNFSNTARTLTDMIKDLPGTVVGLIGTLAGHNPITAALVGGLTKTIGKDVPDAMKLGLFKWLGSGQAVDAEGFHAMVNYIHHARQGENNLGKAVKNLFRAGSEVIPARLMPSDKDRERLKKSVDNYQQSPERMLNVAGKTGYYLPNHSIALTQTAANAVNYLKSMDPNRTPASPLDTKIPPTPYEMARYNRILDIAQQPLMILQHIAEGRLTPEDVDVQKTLYPGLYTRMSQKMTNEMVNAKAKGHQIPYKTRMSMSLYLGQAMDSTLTQQGILSAQPKPQQNQPQTATQPASNPKRSTSSLNKLPGMYQTNTQAAAANRNKID